MCKVRLSITQKVVMCIAATFVAMLALLLFNSRTIVLTGFAQLEQQDVETNLTRLKNSINDELNNLSKACADWAMWDDSYNFVQGKFPNFAKENITIEVLANLKLNFMIYLDRQGRIFHASVADYLNKKETELPKEMAELILATKSLYGFTEPTDFKKGILMLGGRPILAAARAITNNLLEKPVQGTLIMARYLDDAVIRELQERTCLNIKIEKDKYPGLSRMKNAVEILDEQTIAGYTNFYGIKRDEYVTFQIQMPRRTYNYGKGTIKYFIQNTALLAFLGVVVLLYVLRAIILEPLNRLNGHFQAIAKNHNLSTKLYTDRSDEIGSMARSFDSLMINLKRRMRELAEKQFMTNCLNVELTQTTERLQQANNGLKQLTEQLQNANEELKNFVHVASHDLREPLRKIVVFGQMLQKSLKDKVDGNEAESLHFMVDGAERMKKMIDGLLIYSRVSTQPHPFQRMDLNEIVSHINKFELSILIEETNTVVEVPKPLPLIIGDAAQLTQLMQNLIANGIKYQKRGSRPVITITSKPAADGMVRIEVTDNGIGIKPEYHSAVFGMFKRLHGKEYEGTGIGLATCKKIVERHNGKIGIESQPGKGSTFWFTIAEVPTPTPASVAQNANVQ
jgi:signal transduction histidine kinase